MTLEEHIRVAQDFQQRAEQDTTPLTGYLLDCARNHALIAQAIIAAAAADLIRL